MTGSPRSSRALLLLAALGPLAACGCGGNVAPREILITPASVVVRPGQTVQFRNMGTGTPTTWRVVGESDQGSISTEGLYRAPHFPPANPTTSVEGWVGTHVERARVTFAHALPDPSSCMGVEQDHLPVHGEFVYIDSLPEVRVAVPPEYPEEAREAGVQGLVAVDALVCASGLVYATQVVTSIPMLDQAAVDAVRQWEFTPAIAGDHPVAVWVSTRIRFTLHAPPRMIP